MFLGEFSLYIFGNLSAEWRQQRPSGFWGHDIFGGYLGHQIVASPDPEALWPWDWWGAGVAGDLLPGRFGTGLIT